MQWHQSLGRWVKHAGLPLRGRGGRRRRRPLLLPGCGSKKKPWPATAQHSPGAVGACPRAGGGAAAAPQSVRRVWALLRARSGLQRSTRLVVSSSAEISPAFSSSLQQTMHRACTTQQQHSLLHGLIVVPLDVEEVAVAPPHARQRGGVCLRTACTAGHKSALH